MKFKSLLLILLIPSIAYADLDTPLNFTESDGTPSTYPYKVKVSNGTLTDNGDGTITITTTASVTSADVTGTQAIDRGGTGIVSYTKGDLLAGVTLSSALNKLPVGSMGQHLSVDTGATAGMAWVTGVVSSDVNAGVFGVNRGGSGFSTYAKGDLLLGVTNGSALNKQSVGSMGQILSVDTGSTTGVAWVTGIVSSDTNAGVFSVARGGSGHASYTKGDLLVGVTGNSALNKLAVGTNGKVLSADSSTTTGLVWATLPAGGSSPLSTKGDIYAYSSADARFPVGSMGQIISVDTAATFGFKWVNFPAGGAGDITAVGNCITGACFDGTETTGEYLRGMNHSNGFTVGLGTAPDSTNGGALALEGGDASTTTGSGGSIYLYGGTGVVDSDGGSIEMWPGPSASGNAPRVYINAVDNVSNPSALEIKIQATQANVTTSDIFVTFGSTTGTEGSIAGTAVAGVIAYNTFLGSHWTKVVGEKPEVGMVLEMTGKVLDKGNGGTEYLAEARVCRTASSGKVYGVYGGTDPSGHDLVFAVGAGMVLVSGPVKAGDLLEADGNGYARRQWHPLIFSSTLGKSSEDYDGKQGVKMIGCVFYAG